MNTMKLPRRRFLNSLVVAGVAPWVNMAAQGSANRRVRLGLIGCGGRARQMIPMFLSHPDAEVVAVSDVIEPRMREAAGMVSGMAGGRAPQEMVDYRGMLDRADLDAVVVSTTQHWHGLPHIESCQAGKHVFVEKPLSHTVSEGRAMVKATQRAGVVAMMGTQQRAGPHYQQAVERVRSGRLGKVALVESWNYHQTGNRVGRPTDEDVPKGMHWDRWLGPAPWAPFNRARLDSSWWFDYGGGMLTNWGVHHLDIIYWAMNGPAPVSVHCAGGKFVVKDLADSPDTIEATWEFPGWLMQYRYRGFNTFHSVQDRPHHHGICFYGSEATLVIDRHGYQIWENDRPGQVSERMEAVPYFDRNQPMRSEQDGPWQRWFIECVQGKRAVPLELEESHQATVWCQLANIAYLAGRKISWDGERETIPGDAEAAARLERARRPGYELPDWS
jgi:predicted dehydrogenase